MSDVETEWSGIGAQVRTARKAAGMSVRELARRIGVSASHVSQVERGLGSFSAAVLYAVATALEVSMDTLFTETDPASGIDVPTSRHPVPISHDTAGETVLRKADRPHMTFKDGPRWERLTAHAESDAEFLEVQYSPTTTSPDDIDFVRHDGREYGVIIEGRLHVQIGFDTTVLEVGDSVCFNSTTPHKYWNEGDTVCRAIWFVREGGAHGATAGHIAVDPAASRRLA